MNNLPVFRLTINEDLNAEQEVSAVALVDMPAIEKPFFAFKDAFVEPSDRETQDEWMGRCMPAMIGEGKDQEQAAAICYSKWERKGMGAQKFAVVNEDERLVVGPAMIPDMLIYRKDADGFEYNVVFGKQDISKIAVKFFAKNMQKNGNEMHNESRPVDLVFYQSWIADESKGIPKMKQFEDLPDGTWFLGAKINDDEAWQSVKEGRFKGFSVEGIFEQIPIKTNMSAEQKLAIIENLLKDI